MSSRQQWEQLTGGQADDQPTYEQLVRTTTVEIRELVPARDRLPRCVGWLATTNLQCGNLARYTQQGEPVCGVHLGRPGLIFISAKYRRP